jgi:hypothetical protein
MTVLDPHLHLGGLFLPDIRAASEWKPSLSLRRVAAGGPGERCNAP